MSVTLVTGGSGFVGRHLVAELSRRGVAVRTTVRAPTEFGPGVDVRVVGDLASHGELDMSAMSMVFQVKDAALLDRLQAGDRVTATILKENGVFYIVKAEKAD